MTPQPVANGKSSYVEEFGSYCYIFRSQDYLAAFGSLGDPMGRPTAYCYLRSAVTITGITFVTVSSQHPLLFDADFF